MSETRLPAHLPHRREPRLLGLYVLALAALVALASACGRDDPLAGLEAAVQQLQDELEGKKTSSVVDLLHPEFSAREGLDRDWARRTMTGLFLRYRNVRIVALARKSRLDAHLRDVGYTEATVVLTGAEGLLPDRASDYRVMLEWRRDGGEWKLYRLDWQ